MNVHLISLLFLGVLATISVGYYVRPPRSYPAPKRLTLTPKSSSEMQLDWQFEDDLEVSYYVTELGRGKEEVKNFNTNTTFVTLSGLVSAKEYYAQVYAIYDTGVASTKSFFHFYTPNKMGDLYPPPSDLRAVDARSNKLRLLWFAPSHTDTFVKYFKVKLHDQFAQNVTVLSADTQIELDNLAADSKYKVAVSAVYGEENDESAALVLYFHTGAEGVVYPLQSQYAVQVNAFSLDSNLAPPQSLSITLDRNDILSATWLAPEDQSNGKILFYFVVASFGGVKRHFYTEKTNIVLGRPLFRCIYTIEVTAVYSHGKMSDPVDADFDYAYKSDVPHLSTKTIAVVDEKEGFITIAWETPAHEVAQGYFLGIYDGLQGNLITQAFTTSTSYNVSAPVGLNPFEEVKISVLYEGSQLSMPVTYLVKRGPMQIVKVDTLAVEMIFASSIGSTYVGLNWMPLGSAIRDVAYYSLLYKPLYGTTYSMPKTIEGLALQLTGLQITTEYELKLVAVYKDMARTEPMTLKFTTANDDSVGLRTVNAYRVSGIDWVVSWDAPLGKQNTTWTYTMYVNEDNDKRKTTPVQETHYRLWASPGIGWRYVLLEATNGEAAHQAWFAFYVPHLCGHALTNLEVTNVTAHSAVVDYGRPEWLSDGEKPKSETVYYVPTDSLHYTSKTYSKGPALLENLKAGTSYAAIVERSCDSAWKSSAIFFQTPEASL